MMALENKNPVADENPESNTEEVPSTESVEVKGSTESDTEEDYFLEFTAEEASLPSPTVDAEHVFDLVPAYVHDGRARLFTDDSMSPEQKRHLGLKDIVKGRVLPLLPAKSLCRFKSVCKEWNQQINSPFFAHLQSYSFRKLSGFICQYQQSYSHAFISMDLDAYGIPYHSFQFLPEEVAVRTSSNGLVCCQGYTEDNGYYICNPVTKQWHALPPPKLYHGPQTAIALAYKPGVYNFSENYELICAVPISDQPMVYFEIFSSRSRTWRVVEPFCSDLNGFFRRDGFCINGLAYWETAAGEVLVFDLVYEQYSVFLLPVKHGAHGVLTESNGELCYVLPSEQENDECLIEVYGGMDMKLKYSISFPLENNPSYPLQALPSLSDEMFLVLVGTKLAIYYVKEKEALFVDLERINVFGKFVPYVNSLVPVRHHLLFNEIQLSNLNLNAGSSSSSSPYAGQARAY